MSHPPSTTAHPRRGDFRWIDHDGPFRRITPAQARQYDEQGFFVLEGALSETEIASVTAAIDPFEAEVEAFLDGLEDRTLFIARGGEITFTTHVAARSDLLRAFVSGPLFQDLGHDLLGDDVRLYWDQAVYKKPGTDDPFPWHQDNGYTFIEPQQYLTCWVALTDATEDNGCPWVVPGLHRQGTLEHRLTDTGFRCLEGWPDQAVVAPVRAGDIVVFSSLTPHATGPNRTVDEVRKAYIVQLAPDGAEAVADDGTRARVDDPDRQPVILAGGRPPVG